MKREKGLDFVRAVCTIGVVTFHFFYHTQLPQQSFLTHANGSWGGTLNYLFFALSGLVMHLNYGPAERLNLRLFYYRRWKGTMPAFLLVYAGIYSIFVLHTGHFFFLPVPRKRLLLTLIGMDGYLNMFLPTYFIIGEWFLGAVLILYALYPLLKKPAGTRWRFWILLGLSGLNIWIFRSDFSGVFKAVNPLICLLCFYTGMLLAADSKSLRSPWLIAGAMLCFAVMVLLPLEGENPGKELLAGISLLILLNRAGLFICQNALCFRIVSVLSRLSYYIFLIHHSMIIILFGFINPTNFATALPLFAATLAFILLCAWILEQIMSFLFRTELYQRLESALIGGLPK